MSSSLRFLLILSCLCHALSFTQRFQRHVKYDVFAEKSPHDDSLSRSKEKLLRDARRLREEVEKLENESSGEGLNRLRNSDFTRMYGGRVANTRQTVLDSFVTSSGQQNSSIQNTSILVRQNEEDAKRLAVLNKLAGTAAHAQQTASVQPISNTSVTPDVYKDIHPWLLRVLVKFMVSLLFFDVDRSDSIVKEDTEVLESAFALEMNDTVARAYEILSDDAVDGKETANILNNLVEFDAIRTRAYTRAAGIRDSLGLPARSKEELLAIVATELQDRGNNSASLSEVSRWYQTVLDKGISMGSVTDATSPLEHNPVSSLRPGDGKNEEALTQVPNETDPWSKLVAALEDTVEDAKCSAERFVIEYFDFSSRKLGDDAVGRDGAARFQNEVLRDIFEVSAVTFYQGAIIYDGLPRSNAASHLGEEIATRLAATSMDSDISFVVMMNERYPSLEDGIAQAAMESLLKTSQSVIIFPKTWRSNIDIALTDPSRVFWRTLLSTSTALSSAIFAAGSYHLFRPDTGDIFQLGVALPPDILPMAMTPLFVHYIASLAEVIAGRLRGFDVKPYILPTFTLFTFGTRSTFSTRPKNRNDLFDVSAIGLSSALISSFVLLWIGLDITVHSPKELLDTFPSISSAFIKTNTVLAQWISSRFPGIFDSIANTEEVHLHWLAIAGGCSLLAQTFQLLPLDNSAGAKMSYAVLGRETFSVLSLFAGFFKFLFIIPIMINLGSSVSPVLSKTRLLFDYLISSQIATSALETQVAVDELADVTEGRRIVFLGFVSFLVFSLFPSDSVASSITDLINSVFSPIDANPGNPL